MKIVFIILVRFNPIKVGPFMGSFRVLLFGKYNDNETLHNYSPCYVLQIFWLQKTAHLSIIFVTSSKFFDTISNFRINSSNNIYHINNYIVTVSNNYLPIYNYKSKNILKINKTTEKIF